MAGLRGFGGLVVPDEELEAKKDLYAQARAGTEGAGGEVGRGFTSGILGGVGAGYQSTVGAVQEGLGLDPNPAYTAARGLRERAASAAPTVNKWDQVHGLSDFGKYAAGAVGQGFATTLPGVATMAATRSPKLALGTMFPMEMGEAVGAVRDGTPSDVSTQDMLTGSIAKGAVNTALETVPLMNIFGRGPLRGVMRGATIPQRVGGHMLAEGTTELAQERVGQVAQDYMQPGRDTSGDAEALREAFLQGGLGGAGFAAPSAAAHALADTGAGVKDFISNKFPAKGMPTPLDDLVDGAKNAGTKLKEKFQDLGESTAEIMDNLKNPDREGKKFSQFTTGKKSASEDADDPDGFLAKQLEGRTLPKGISLKDLANAIDDYASGGKFARLNERDGRMVLEGQEIRKEDRFLEGLVELFGDRRRAKTVLDRFTRAAQGTDTALGRAAQDENDDVLKNEISPDVRFGLADAARGRPYVNDPKASKQEILTKLELLREQEPDAMHHTVSMKDFFEEAGRDVTSEHAKILKAAEADLAQVIRLGAQDRKSGSPKEYMDRRVAQYKKLKLLVDTLKDGTPEEAMSKLHVIRSERFASDDIAASDTEMQAYGEKAGKKGANLVFAGPEGDVHLNARQILNVEMKKQLKQGYGGKFVPKNVLMYQALMAGIGNVIAKGHELKTTVQPVVYQKDAEGYPTKAIRLEKSIPPETIVAKNTTFGDLVASMRTWEKNTSVGNTTSPFRSELEQRLLPADTESMPIKWRVETLIEHAARGYEQRQEVLASQDDVMAALDAAQGRLANSKLPKNQKDRYNTLINRERNLYLRTFAAIQEDDTLLRFGGDRPGLVGDEDLGQETMRGQDPQGPRFADEFTGETLGAYTNERKSTTLNAPPFQGEITTVKKDRKLKGMKFRRQPPVEKPVGPAVAKSSSDVVPSVDFVETKLPAQPPTKTADDQKSKVRVGPDGKTEVKVLGLPPNKQSQADLVQPKGKDYAAEAAEKEKGRRFSRADMLGVGEHTLTDAEKRAIHQEIIRTRGTEGLNIAFSTFENIGGSGSWWKVLMTNQRFLEIAYDISFSDAMSTGHHEALHDFFGVLRDPKSTPDMREAAAAIERATELPHIKKQLQELLKGKSAALKQIEESPEEAAAYLYQFFRAGLIKDMAPAARTWFERIAAFFRGIFGAVSTADKAERLLTALSEGKFAERSTVGEVITGMRLNTITDKLRRVSGPLWNVGDAVLSSTNDRLRHTNIPALRELADMFHMDPDRERGKLKFLQKRAMNTGKWNSKLHEILRNHKQEDLRKALEELQSHADTGNPLVRDIRKYLDDMHTYLSKSGVQVAEKVDVEVVDPDTGEKRTEEVTKYTPIGERKVKNYFPRIWDRELIANNKEQFKELLRQHGKMTDVEANHVYNSIVENDEQFELAEGVAFTPFLQAATTRQLTFIRGPVAAEFAQFQKKDMVSIMSTYTYQAVHRAEYTRFFGNEGHVIKTKLHQAREQGATPKDIATAEKGVAAMLGTLGHNMSPGLRKLQTNIMTYENIVLLPFALMNNFMDVMGVGVRSNDMSESWNAMKEGVRGIVRAVRKQGPDAQEEMARTLGFIDENAELASYGLLYDGQYMGGFAKKVSDKFFKWNGMMTWNTRMRVAAMNAGMRFIKRHADLAMGKKDEQSIRFLKDLNLTYKDVRRDAHGNPIFTLEAWADKLGKPEDDPAVRAAATKMQEALFRFVDGAMIRPNAAHRPIWGSDPHWMLVFHLKQFTYSFQQVTMKYVRKEMENGNSFPALALMGYVPFAMFTDVTRSALLGRPIDASVGGLLNSALRNSAVVGTGTFGVDAWNDAQRGSIPGSSFAGPAASHALQAMQTFVGEPGSTWDKLLIRSVPASPAVKALVS
jgi:hypothetical protein